MICVALCGCHGYSQHLLTWRSVAGRTLALPHQDKPSSAPRESYPGERRHWACPDNAPCWGEKRKNHSSGLAKCKNIFHTWMNFIIQRICLTECIVLGCYCLKRLDNIWPDNQLYLTTYILLKPLYSSQAFTSAALDFLVKVGMAGACCCSWIQKTIKTYCNHDASRYRSF